MDKIGLKGVVPAYFDQTKMYETSDIWDSALTINRGESYLIKASSGGGKSSLCSFIYGIRRDYNGSLLFDGSDCSLFSLAKWVKCRRDSIAILFQDLKLFPELTVIENIELKNRLTNHKRRCEIVDMLDSLGVGTKIDTMTGQLSLGEQQRVAFVRSLCQPFDFILLDEPVSHLDSKNGAIIANLLKEECKKQNAGVVVTSVGNDLELNYDNILHL